MKITKTQFDVETLAARIAVTDEALANVEVFTHRDEMFRQVVFELKAKVLAGAPRTVTAHAYIETSTVDSVWDAVCVYWLATMFYVLYDMTHWQWVYEGFMWANGHERIIIERDSETKEIKHLSTHEGHA